MSDYLTYDVWFPLSNRVDDGGLDNLSEDQQTLYLCFDFVCQIDNGGLSGYGYNADASERKALVFALGRIGASLSADLMRRANDILDSPVPTETAKTWEQFLAFVDPDHELDRIDESLVDQIESEGVRDAVDALAARLNESS